MTWMWRSAELRLHCCHCGPCRRWGVVTPPRRGVDEHGGLRAPGSRLPPRGTRVAPQIFTEARYKGVGSDRRNVPWSPENILIDMVVRLQRELADIRAESRQLQTPGVSPFVPTPRQDTFTTTKVPRFAGMTSWEQYRQVFDAIVLSNGWDGAMAALQLLSHLEGDALNVAPSNIKNVKAFGDMGQTARLQLIRDRFIAGHSSCELRRYLDSVPPETPIREVVDRCRVWESHADPEIRRVSKPGPEPIYPAYLVGDSDKGVEEIRVTAVTKPKSTLDRVEAGAAAPAPVPAPFPEVLVVEKLLQRLVAESQIRQPAPVVTSEPAGVETLLRSLLSGHLAPVQQPRQGPFRCDWNAVVCFSCGKAGHSATRCPTLEDTGGLRHDFTLVGGGASSSGKRRLIWAGCSPPGSVVRFDPRTQGEVQHGSPLPGKQWIWRRGIHPCRPSWVLSGALTDFGGDGRGDRSSGG